jgi:hypothetical protein
LDHLPSNKNNHVTKPDDGMYSFSFGVFSQEGAPLSFWAHAKFAASLNREGGPFLSFWAHTSFKEFTARNLLSIPFVQNGTRQEEIPKGKQ